MSITTKEKPAVTATATATATPLEAEKIAYTTLEKGKPTLWIMNPEGSERTRLTAIGTSTWFPLWSPNGKLLAFLSNMSKDGTVNLYVGKKGSTQFEQITAFSDMTIGNPGSLKAPFSWSPKSDEIAFAYHNQVWKVDLTTHLQTTLTSQDPAYSISTLEWAPHRDNKYVAFLVKKGINFFGLMLVNPRLMDQLKLVESTYPVSDITWSPDAKIIAYTQNNYQIYTASAETSIPKLIINNASPELGSLISYSPAETTPVLMVLAKKDISDQGYRVATVAKSSSGKDAGTFNFLTEPGVDNAVWSPDGRKIAYTQSGVLWVMEANGSGKTRVAATGILSPNWSKK